MITKNKKIQPKPKRLRDLRSRLSKAANRKLEPYQGRKYIVVVVLALLIPFIAWLIESLLSPTTQNSSGWFTLTPNLMYLFVLTSLIAYWYIFIIVLGGLSVALFGFLKAGRHFVPKFIAIIIFAISFLATGITLILMSSS